MSDWKTRRDELADNHCSRQPEGQQAFTSFLSGFDAGRADTLERIKPLISALEFYQARTNIPIKEICTAFESAGSTIEITSNYTNRAREALLKWKEENE